MASKEKINIKIPVVPELDKRATANTIRDLKNLEKNLLNITEALKGISKNSGPVIRNIRRVSDEVGKSAKGLASGGGGGGKARAKGGGPAGIGSDKNKDKLSTKQNRNIGQHNALLQKQIRSTKNMIQAQERYVSDLRRTLKSGVKELGSSLPNLLRDGLQGGGGRGLKSVISNLTRGAGGMSNIIKGFRSKSPISAGGIAKGIGGAARAAGGAGGGGGGGAGAASAAAGGDMAAMVGGLSGNLAKFAGVMGIAVAAISVFIKVIEMTSQASAKLNRELTAGTSIAKDAGAGSEAYRKSLANLREGVRAADWSMRAFGGNSELTSKIIGTFARETGGSIQQLQNDLHKIGDGNLDEGIEKLAKSAMVFGQALGMSAEDATVMMGHLNQELGYTREASIDALGEIVRGAAAANMPVSKFMGIFHSVIPDMETYQNRLEELTGTIRLLSKTMSSKDVKNFTDSFSASFKGMDFKQRLGTALKVGVGKVSGILAKDFDSKARSMAKNFSKYGVNEEDFTKAIKGGEKATANMLAKARKNASAQGETIDGAQIGSAQKLARYEGARQKGDALNITTAMSGAGMMANYKIMKELSQRFGTGFDGLQEYVISKGMSNEQYEALRSMDENLAGNTSLIKETGGTEDRTLNTALAEIVSRRTKKSVDQLTLDDMKTVSKDEILEATVRAQELSKDNKKIFDLGQEQYNVTSSIGDKIDNVISFLLEQILRVLDPLADYLDQLVAGVFGLWKDGGQKQVKKADEITDNLKAYAVNRNDQTWKKAGGDQFLDIVNAEVKKGSAKGHTGDKLVQDLSSSSSLKETITSMDPKGFKKVMENMARGYKYTGTQSREYSEKISKAQITASETGDIAPVLKLLDELKDWEGNGGVGENVLHLSGRMAERGLTSQEAKDKAAGLKTKRDPADTTRSKTAQEKIAETNAANAKKIVDLSKVKNVSDLTDQSLPISGAPSAVPGAVTTTNPATSASGPTKEVVKTQEDAAKVAEKTHEEILDSTEAAVSTAENADDSNSLLSKIEKHLYKGIKLDPQFTEGKYKNVIKESTLESFRTALFEFALLTDAATVDKWKPQFEEGGITSAVDAMTMTQSWLNGKEQKERFGIKGDWKGPSFDTGGSVNYDQVAKVHAGEYVVPKGGVLVSGSGGSGGSGSKVVNVNATINVNSQASAAEIRDAVHSLYKQQ